MELVHHLCIQKNDAINVVVAEEPMEEAVDGELDREEEPMEEAVDGELDGEQAENQVDPEEDDGAPVAGAAGPYVPPRMGPRRDPRARLVGGFRDHTMAPIPPSKTKKNPQRKCNVCLNRRKVRRDTRYWCVECEVALCKVGCFNMFHSTEKYK